MWGFLSLLLSDMRLADFPYMHIHKCNGLLFSFVSWDDSDSSEECKQAMQCQTNRHGERNVPGTDDICSRRRPGSHRCHKPCTI